MPASDGRQALELLKQSRYDILLTDIKMPFIDGLELSREARQLQPQLSIMIFSGYGEFEYAQSAISLGVTEYLLKPVDAAVFREALDRVIGDLNHRRDLHRNVQLARKHLLFTLLNGERVPDGERTLTPDCRLMMVISFANDFFSAEGEQFESLLEQTLDVSFDFVSLYPSEGLVFFSSDMPAPEQTAESLRALAGSLTDEPCEISWTALNAPSEILPAYQRLSRLESGDLGTETLPFPLDACMEAIRSSNLRLCAEHYERFRAAALDGCVYSRIYTRYAMAQVLCSLNHLQPSGLSDSAIVDQIFACHDFESLDRLMLGQLSRTGVDGNDGSVLRTFGSGDMSVTVPVSRSDEIGQLERSFNDMAAHIRELIEVTYNNELREREYQQRLLQAQINPHFLYNSLSIINSKAILAEQPEISDMAMQLSRFYRSALNHGRQTTTIQGELENIHAYVNLQLMLGSNRFTPVYDVDHSISNVRIPNFILQPIVENAIEHGLRCSLKPDRTLTIRVLREDSDVIFIVHDNGAGMDEATLNSLYNEKTEGYGIRNVDDRLRLTYGDRYSMRIISELGVSTTAILRLPADFLSNA